MVEKRKEKNDQAQPLAPKWTFVLFGFILLTAFFFLAFSLLRAYPWLEVYLILSFAAVIGLLIMWVLVLIIGMFKVRHSSDKKLLGLLILAIGGCSLSRIIVMLFLVGWIIAPITLLILLIYFLDLTAKLPARWDRMLFLLSLAFTFAIALIMTAGYMLTLTPSAVYRSTTLGSRSYHIILDSGVYDSTKIHLVECNKLGMMCDTIYQSDRDYYPPNDQFDWEIVEGERTTINLLVNGEAIHSHIIK